MAEAVQARLRQLEVKVKPYLYEGPLASYWALLEQKTKLKRERIALGLVVVLVVYLAFGWGNDFICNLIGFLYPAYASVLAVESTVKHDDTEWLIYWVVYTSFGFVEYIGYNFFRSLSFYWLGKCLFLIWLMAPGKNGGSQLLYQRLIRPLVLKYQPTIDRNLQNADAYIKQYSGGNRN